MYCGKYCKFVGETPSYLIMRIKEYGDYFFRLVNKKTGEITDEPFESESDEHIYPALSKILELAREI
jgi:hypothetical protein